MHQLIVAWSFALSSIDILIEQDVFLAQFYALIQVKIG